VEAPAGTRTRVPRSANGCLNRLGYGALRWSGGSDREPSPSPHAIGLIAMATAMNNRDWNRILNISLINNRPH
jgi:hypothetical protein